MSLKQVLNLVSFLDTMELLLPSTQNTSADLSSQSSPHTHSPRLDSTNTHPGEAGNLDGGMDSPNISLEGEPSPSRARAKGDPNGDDTEQGPVEEMEENSAQMTNGSNPTTPPGGVTYQMPTMTPPGTEMSRSQLWYFNRPPNSRVSQVLPFQRLSTLLSASLSGGACTPGGGCAIGPKPPPSGTPPVSLTGIVSTSHEIQTPHEGPSRADHGLSDDPSTVEDGMKDGIPPPTANSQNSSGQPTHRPRAAPSALVKGNGLQRPNNPLGRILEEGHELSQSIQTKRSPPPLGQVEDASTAAMVRSQSNILGSLFLNAYPRPKPSATDTLLYWLLQDHTMGDDVPTFSRGQDQKSLFRLMICLWAEPVVGSGPFDKEWKRLLREREMRRWSEVGGEADVNVVSVLVMMSLFGAEVGLGWGQSKIRHRPVTMLENRVVSTASNSRAVTSPPRTPKTRQASGTTTASGEPGALSLPGSREGLVGICPVCKRKGNRTSVCPCAYSLLQGMGVFAPTIPRHAVPPPPTLHSSRTTGRRPHPVGQSSGADTMISRTQSVPAALKRPHTATQRQSLKVQVNRRPSTARDASPMSPPGSLGSAHNKVHDWRVDGMERVVNAMDREEAKASTNKVSTIHLDWDPTSTPSVVMASQTEDSSPRHPLLTISDTTLSETPAPAEAYHNAQEVQSEGGQDVKTTLFGATAKLYAENAQSPETPASLVELSEGSGDSVEEQLTPLTNKQVNLLSEDERESELAMVRKSKNSEVSTGSELFTSSTGTTGSVEANQAEFRDEDCPPQWMQTRSHSGSVGL